MKTVAYTSAALADLAKHKNRAAKIMDKVDRYAQTGAGDVKQLVGSPAKRPAGRRLPGNLRGNRHNHHRLAHRPARRYL